MLKYDMRNFAFLKTGVCHLSEECALVDDVRQRICRTGNHFYRMLIFIYLFFLDANSKIIYF